MRPDAPARSRRFLLSTCSLPFQPPPRPAPPAGGKKRKRVSEDIPDCKVPKPLLSGSIPVDQFVQTLEKVRLCCPRCPGPPLRLLAGLLLKDRAAAFSSSPLSEPLSLWFCLVQGQPGHRPGKSDRGEEECAPFPQPSCPVPGPPETASPTLGTGLSSRPSCGGRTAGGEGGDRGSAPPAPPFSASPLLSEPVWPCPRDASQACQPWGRGRPCGWSLCVQPTPPSRWLLLPGNRYLNCKGF